MADASTVPSRVTCWRSSDATFAAVIPITTGGALERPTSQPKRGQSCALAAVPLRAHASVTPSTVTSLCDFLATARLLCGSALVNAGTRMATPTHCNFCGGVITDPTKIEYRPPSASVQIALSTPELCV